jgi:hypothetical protein
MTPRRSGQNRSMIMVGTLAAVLLVACAPSASAPSESEALPSSDPSSATSLAPSAAPSEVAVVECDAPEGSVNDVATEPDWRGFGEYREWTTEDGCLIRIDILGDRPGPEHCGFESARVIVTGIPVGTRYTDASDDAEYIRDPENVFGDQDIADAFDPDAELPPGAEDTGFRSEGTELWVDPANDSVIYLVTGTTIESWPLDPEPTGCA